MAAHAEASFAAHGSACSSLQIPKPGGPRASPQKMSSNSSSASTASSTTKKRPKKSSQRNSHLSPHASPRTSPRTKEKGNAQGSALTVPNPSRTKETVKGDAQRPSRTCSEADATLLRRAGAPQQSSCVSDKDEIAVNFQENEQPATTLLGKQDEDNASNASNFAQNLTSQTTCSKQSLHVTGINSKMTVVWSKMKDRVDFHKHVLEDACPKVALIVAAADADDPEASPDTPSIPEGLELCASASLKFYGAPAVLWVLTLKIPKPSERPKSIDLDSQKPMLTLPTGPEWTTPSERLAVVKEVLDTWKGTCLGGTVPWALHDPLVSEAMLAKEAEVLAFESHSWSCGAFNRALHVLRICSPDEDGLFLQAFKNQYGPSAAFADVSLFFFIQALWMLVPIAILAMIFDFSPAGADGVDRVKFEILKVIVIVWGIVISSLCSTRFQGEQAVAELERNRMGMYRASTKNECFVREDENYSSLRRLSTLCFVALPCLAAFLCLCMFTLITVTNTILHIIYVWGDCYNLHTADQLCRDAEQTHGIFGWAAEVGCDVALALLFELFFGLSVPLTTWISTLLNFEYENDRKYFRSMLEVFLSALERIGFVGSLAFFFVPQWTTPHDKDVIDMGIDCSDLLMTDSNFTCLQRRLPLKLRRWLFEKLMKGPFMVAPFIAILIKTIIPVVVYALSQACDLCLRIPSKSAYYLCLVNAPFRFIARFFTLIFSLDGDNVGCFKFACKGWPFSEVVPDLPSVALEVPDPPPRCTSDTSPAVSPRALAAAREISVFSVLSQGVRKVFEPDDELMEVEMNFLWVLFFTPLLPFGVITTLVAKLLEIYFDMLKMLHVRRRCFPTCDKVMRRKQVSFVNAVLFGSIGWSAALSLITYNDDLYKWSVGGPLVLLGLTLWLLVCAALGFSRRMSIGCAACYANFVYRLRRLPSAVNSWQVASVTSPGGRMNSWQIKTHQELETE